MDELIQDFIDETFETLDALGGELVAWEANPSDAERLDNIFRFFHTVKGSCGFLNLPRFERLSHSAEDALSKLRDGSLEPSADLVTAILAIVDRISKLTSALSSGDALPDGEDQEVIVRLVEACSGTVSGALEKAKAMPEPGQVTTDSHPQTRAIRIPLDLIDHLMNGVSDMVLARNEVARKMRDGGDNQAMNGAFERLSTCIADMRDMIGKTRMQRIERVFSPLPRLVRDLNAELGKSVTLSTNGSEVEMDREMLEMIRDPLMHIIRNAIDHGIESADERSEAGKSSEGHLSVNARQSGNQILIEIADDGRGIDADSLMTQAVAAKIIRGSECAKLDEQAKLNLIFAPGLSTARNVTSISGRGVGMDVVHANIKRIGGSIDIENKPGHGLKITLCVPLTLTIISCLTVQCGDSMFALPRSAVQEILQADNRQIKVERLGGTDIASIRGMKVPHVTLEEILGLDEVDGGKAENRTVIAIDAGPKQNYALSVASVLDHEELVIRPCPPLLMENGLYAGTSLPDNGRPMLLLDPGGMAAKLDINTQAELSILQSDDTQNSAKDTISVLLFKDMEKRARVINLGVIERVEDIDAERVAFSAGQMRVSCGDGTRPIFGLKQVPDSENIKTLILSDGDAAIYYAIDDIVDIFPMDTEFEKAAEPGLVAGVTMVGGQQAEVIDAYWIFARHASGSTVSSAASRPRCRVVGGDDIWARHILAPLVEAAGYELVADGKEGSAADIYITMEDSNDTGVLPAGAPVIRLASNRAGETETGDAIYRYDREALVEALSKNLKQRKSA
ncbi:ATP-binding protein [Sphingorhabdus sp. Alg239-R122]|uniref:chemotaxis protein CheA n=1 Tax=Sphingorhabdus sp. Alg239-R122 TaxID=2305989 RepID=UPI0013DAC241|nr:ATP-binding protein [Sphingorhabdus sp. Alg239-R122]